MDIYIKPKEKVKIYVTRVVRIKDVADVFVNKGNKQQVEKLIAMEIPQEKNKMHIISVLEIVQIIQQAFPDATVSNLGSSDVLVDYYRKPEKENKILLFLKIALVSIILFAGASTTIMAFHTDSDIPGVLKNYNKVFGNGVEEIPKTLSVSYSLGLALGIFVFFNHFSKLAISNDPTPIEVEISLYEEDTIASMVQYLGKQEEKDKNGK